MRNRVDPERIEYADKLVKAGKSVKEAAKLAGIGRATYYRYGKKSER